VVLFSYSNLPSFIPKEIRKQMNDTSLGEVSSPVTQLQTKIDELVAMHRQQAQVYQNLEQQREMTRLNLMKLEGAIEALSSFKSTTFEANQVPGPASIEEGSETSQEEIVDATYIDETEKVN
jgi:hypothetical protein